VLGVCIFNNDWLDANVTFSGIAVPTIAIDAPKSTGQLIVPQKGRDTFLVGFRKASVKEKRLSIKARWSSSTPSIRVWRG
jgi:hypothetical protein